MGVEEVVGVDGLTTDFRVEVGASGAHAAAFKDGVHGEGHFGDVVGELVGVPAALVVAAVEVYGTEEVVACGEFEFVLEGVARECRVVHFNVYFYFVLETVFEQEAVDGGAVEVVLVFGGFVGFGLDEDGAFVADFVFVFNDHVEEATELVDLLGHFGVEEGFVAFASAPEYVVFAVEFVGGFDAVFYLGGGVGEYFWIGVGACAGHVAWVAEKVGGAPEEFDAGFVHFGLEFVGDVVEVVVGLGEGGAFGGDVFVVEAVVGDAHFFDEFESDVYFLLGLGHEVGALVPGATECAVSEYVGAGPAEGVPPADGGAEVFFHGFAKDDFVCVVVAEGEGIGGVGAFVFDLVYVCEVFAHGWVSFYKVVHDITDILS